MSRHTGPVCKLCRREGMKLFLKGDRCYMSKCAVDAGRPAPGVHGQRRTKLSDYGTQLREKQKLRRIYGVQEAQFRGMFQRALSARGITGEKLLQMLEMRLDNLVYRFGFAPSRRAARQFVTHGHIEVNGRKASICSMILKEGDIVTVRNRENSRQYSMQYLDTAESRGISVWLSLDKAQLKGTVLKIPTRDELAPIVKEQLIVELYSK